MIKFTHIPFLLVCYFSFLVVYQFEPDELLGLSRVSPAAASFVSPALGATLASATYYVPSGPRVAALAGAIGFSSVAVTYATYTVLGIPYGSRGFLFF